MSINQTIRAKILEILQDKQWHELGELLNIAGQCITSEKASQIYLTYQKSGKRDQTRPLEEQIQMGKRWVIMAQCRKLCKADQIIQQGEGFNRQFLLKTPDESVSSKKSPLIRELRTQIKKMEEILNKYEASQ